MATTPNAIIVHIAELPAKSVAMLYQVFATASHTHSTLIVTLF